MNMSATRATPGAISLRISTHLPPIDDSKLVNPVMFPPGRARFVMKPVPMGSEICTNTIGMVSVSLRNTMTDGVV